MEHGDFGNMSLHEYHNDNRIRSKSCSKYKKNINMIKKKQNIIPPRIESIKNLLKNVQIESLVNFDRFDTENFETGGSIGTRKVNGMTEIIGKGKYCLDDVIYAMDGRLEYIKSGTTGHTFKLITKKGEHFGMKIVAYPIKNQYGNINISTRPENAEILMVKLLSRFVVLHETPHIVLPIVTFNCYIDPFLTLIEDGIITGPSTPIDGDHQEKNKKGELGRYQEFVDKYKKGHLHREVSVLISEWANRGDLLDFIKSKYEVFETRTWKIIFFQIISVLALIQSKYPNFRHNDLKPNNILVHKTTSTKTVFKYTICNRTFKLPNNYYCIKLWDFDFSCISGIIDNIKVSMEWTKDINVTPIQNQYYDIHYFFNTLVYTGFFPEFLKSSCISREVKEFVGRIVPPKYRTKRCYHGFPCEDEKTKKTLLCDKCHKYVHPRGRIRVNDVYTTPKQILDDPFFLEFRQK